MVEEKTMKELWAHPETIEKLSRHLPDSYIRHLKPNIYLDKNAVISLVRDKCLTLNRPMMVSPPCEPDQDRFKSLILKLQHDISASVGIPKHLLIGGVHTGSFIGPIGHAYKQRRHTMTLKSYKKWLRRRL